MSHSLAGLPGFEFSQTIVFTAPQLTAFDTVTVTAVELVEFAAPSRATAVSVCVPFVAFVVSQETEYGALVSSAPRLAPSSLNCTPKTPTLSFAFAVTETTAETVAPFVGAVSETVGGVVSG